MLLQNPSDIIIERPEEENYVTIRENTLNQSIAKKMSSCTPIRSKNVSLNVLQPVKVKSASIMSMNDLNTGAQKNSQILLLGGDKIRESDMLLSSIATVQNNMNEEKTEQKKEIYQSEENVENKDIINDNNISNDPKLAHNINAVRLQVDFFGKYREVCNYFLSLYLNRDKDDSLAVQVCEHQKVCCLFKLLGMYKTFPLDKELIIERDYVLFASELILQLNDEIHFKILLKIFNSFYSMMLGKKKIKENEDKIGKGVDIDKKTLEIFIQDNLQYNKGLNEDVKLLFEVREINIFSLIQIIALIDKHPSFIENNYHSFDNGEGGNTLFFVLVNLSKISIEQIKSGTLNIYFNKNKNLVDTINEFFFGLIEIYKNIIDHTATNTELNDIGINLNNCYKMANDTQSSVLWKYNSFKEKNNEFKDSTTSDF